MSTLPPPLRPDTTVALVIDLQQRLVPAMHDPDRLVDTAARFLRALPLLRIPIIATEQYPAGLGPTVDALRPLLPWPAYPKTLFSAAIPEVLADLKRLARPNVLVLGIEAHVCLQQSVLDLLRLGHTPHVLTDATSSRRPHDRDTALLRMTHAGAVPTTTESALYELMADATHPAFKDVLKLVR